VWFPDGDAGTPNLEIISPQGHDLNEDIMLSYFFKILKRASKIPLQRFDHDNGGGNMFIEANEFTKDEIKFNNFINRLRANYKELIVKPLKLQMCIEFPELMDDEVFLNQIDIQFHSNQLFEEFKKLGNMEKRAGILGTLLGIQSAEGQPYFHIDYLIDKVMKLTPEEKEENRAYWIKAGKAGAGAAGEGGEAGGGEMGGMPGEGGEVPGGEAPGGEMGGPEAGGGEMGGPESGGAPEGGAPPEAPGAAEFEF